MVCQVDIAAKLFDIMEKGGTRNTGKGILDSEAAYQDIKASRIWAIFETYLAVMFLFKLTDC